MGHSCRTLLWDTLVGHSDRIIVGQIWTREERWLAGVLFCLRCRPSFLLPPSTSSCRTLPFQAPLLHSCLFTVHRLRFGLLSTPFFSSSSLRLRSRLLSLPTLLLTSNLSNSFPTSSPRFICLPGLSLLVSALFRWPCSISIHLSPRSVTAGVRPFPLAMWHFYSFVSQVCPCSISIHFVSQVCHCHFYAFVSQVCRCWCPPFSAGHVAFLFICLAGLSCWCPPFSAENAFVCQPCHC